MSSPASERVRTDGRVLATLANRARSEPSEPERRVERQAQIVPGRVVGAQQLEPRSTRMYSGGSRGETTSERATCAELSRPGLRFVRPARSSAYVAEPRRDCAIECSTARAYTPVLLARAKARAGMGTRGMRSYAGMDASTVDASLNAYSPVHSKFKSTRHRSIPTGELCGEVYACASL